jgi:hypothetical protein
LQAIGAREDLGIRQRPEEADAANSSVPIVAHQQRSDRRPFLAEIAVSGLDVVAEVKALVVERQAQIHVDRAGKAALDPVGRSFLVNFDRAQQLGRHVLEVDGLAINAGGKCVASIELGAHEGQAADDHARSFSRKVIRVAGAGEAVDRDARHTLQRLGHRTVGEGADILRSNDVNNRI